MSNGNWSAVRIPLELKIRLVRLTDRLESAHERGHGGIMPSDLTDRVTLWQVVERAVDEYEEHLRRSGE